MNTSTEVLFNPIGIIKTEFKNTVGIPIQFCFGRDHVGEVELYSQYVDGLKDLNDIQYIYLLYHFNRHSDYKLIVKPYMDETPRGLFSTRAPKRPNGIGLSIVEIIAIENNIIIFKGVDMVDNTPLLDIKPYVPKLDHVESNKNGWYDFVNNNGQKKISDDRF
ncbi:MAG: tRNA (N6-threonylcarbamoyladenosine(37)-N6)-methyltransferase TrmO [Oligoflexia bacterium]|nr:tRNA (N6-threonylcarbamoyladenosine(37)-N6)-methyltransferase TrmO [Oligoflexia bacterium]